MLDTTQGHLGGYVVDKPDDRTLCYKLWDFCRDELRCTSAVDIGCGLGYTVDYWRQTGWERVMGVDGSSKATEGKQDLCCHDYTTGTIDLPHFDLCWSAEFVEHVQERFTGNFLHNFGNATYLMMTHAMPGQAGHHHVNCQEPQYWIDKVSEYCGMRYCPQLTKFCRELAYAEIGKGYFFRQTGLVFCKR